MEEAKSAIGMPYLTREQILGADDLPVEDVDVPEWGGIVRVKTLTGQERDAFEESVITMKKVKRGKRVRTETTPNLKNMRAKLVAHSCVDTKGKLIFSEADVQALGEKSSAALDRVYEASSRLSKITDEDLEELEKNSLSGQSGSSTSD